MTERSAWKDATERRRYERVPLQVEDLVVIGRTVSVGLAQRVYNALAHEPLNRYGERVDWLDIRAQILAAAS